MFKSLLSLFKKSDTKSPQTVRKAPTPKSKPKVASTKNWRAWRAKNQYSVGPAT